MERPLVFIKARKDYFGYRKSGAGEVISCCRLPQEEISPGLSGVYILASGGAEEIAPSVILKCLSDLVVRLWELTTESWETTGSKKQTAASTMLGLSLLSHRKNHRLPSFLCLLLSVGPTQKPGHQRHHGHQIYGVLDSCSRERQDVPG